MQTQDNDKDLQEMQMYDAINEDKRKLNPKKYKQQERIEFYEKENTNA